MKAVTIVTNIDLKTYYKISMAISYKRVPLLVVIIVAVLMGIIYAFDGVFEWDVFAGLMAWMIFVYGIAMPVLIWFMCKKNMKKSPILAEGATYTITKDFIENVSPSCTSKTNWNYIKKVVESDKYFAMLTGGRAFHYLAKDGFASIDDVERFRQMVKANNIKNNFK